MFGYFWNGELARRNPSRVYAESAARYLELDPDVILRETEGARVFSFGPPAEDLLRAVHTDEYVEYVRTAHARGYSMLDRREIIVTPDIFPQALLSAGAGPAALDRILRGELFHAFCAVRPPGHHANAHRAMGFCVFNNAAVAARYAQRRYSVSRVLIVDWDVHPGNGTQEIFWEDPSVFVLSFHQSDLFPESGRSDLTGAGDGKGFNRNIPFRPGTGSEIYRKTFEVVVGEVAEAFRPDLLILSAGFDAHQLDPIGNLKLRDEDYAALTRIAVEATRPYTRGRTLSLLEGGYHLSALRSGVTEHCRALARMARQQAGTLAPARH